MAKYRDALFSPKEIGRINPGLYELHKNSLQSSHKHCGGWCPNPSPCNTWKLVLGSERQKESCTYEDLLPSLCSILLPLVLSHTYLLCIGSSTGSRLYEGKQFMLMDSQPFFHHKGWNTLLLSLIQSSSSKSLPTLLGYWSLHIVRFPFQVLERPRLSL